MSAPRRLVRKLLMIRLRPPLIPATTAAPVESSRAGRADVDEAAKNGGEAQSAAGTSANLSSHKRAGVREAIEAAGATRWFLPPYSPDLDPIEQVFAKLKNNLRKMARRTVETLWDAVAIALDDFPAAECLNYFRNAGYGSA